MHPYDRIIAPITITPGQVLAAAQAIVNSTDDAWQYSEAQVLAVVRQWLLCKVEDILSEAEWHARIDHLDLDRPELLTGSFVEEADELVLPQAPEWAHEIVPALA